MSVEFASLISMDFADSARKETVRLEHSNSKAKAWLNWVC